MAINNENQEPELHSKSARKREMQELQELGLELIKLSESHFHQIPLSEAMHEAIALYRRLKQGEARRRQLQLIGKLMRTEDSAAIASALERLGQEDKLFRRHFHRIERLRDQLIAEGDDALAPLLNNEPELNPQHIRQMIRQARQEAANNKPPAASRKLFRYLRDEIPVIDD